MDCQTFTMKSGTITCKYFNLCHQLHLCLCEVEPYDDGTRSPLPPPPQRSHAKNIPWLTRRLQILALVEKHETMNTVKLMDATNACNGTASLWLKKLTNSGDLIRLTRAITLGPNHRPAIFALAHKED